MTLDRMYVSAAENRIPQTVWANLAGVDCGTVSRAKRVLAVLSERDREKLQFALMAMLELADESAVPIDWRQGARLKPLIDVKIASYRAARSRELREQFLQTASAQ